MANKEESPLIKGLREYFENTPQEQLDKDWQELEKYNQYGPDALEYIEYAMKKFDGVAEEVAKTKEDADRCIFRRSCIFNRDGICIADMELGSIKKCTTFADCSRLAEYDRVHTCMPSQASLENVHRYIKLSKDE